MTHQAVPLSKIVANPFRNIERYAVQDEKIDALDEKGGIPPLSLVELEKRYKVQQKYIIQARDLAELLSKLWDKDVSREWVAKRLLFGEFIDFFGTLCTETGFVLPLNLAEDGGSKSAAARGRPGPRTRGYVDLRGRDIGDLFFAGAAVRTLTVWPECANLFAAETAPEELTMTTPEVAVLLGEPYTKIRWLLTTRQVPLPRRLGMTFDWTRRDVENLRRVLASQDAKQRRRHETAAAKRQEQGARVKRRGSAPTVTATG
jgi:hypothetical protein